MAATTNQLFLPSRLVTRSRSLGFLRRSPSFPLLYFLQNLLTLSHSNAHSLHPNPFADFATTNFNLSSTDIARIFKRNPALKRIKTVTKVEQFVDTLKRYGCTQHQIAFIIKRLPQCLTICAEKVIEPKILLLRDFGIHGDDLAKIVTRAPNILSFSLQRTLIPNAAFLQDIFKRRDLFIKAILRRPAILTYDLEKYLKPSVDFFEKCGLVGEQLSKFILSRPGLLLCTCLTPAQADFLQKIGIDKGSKMYKFVLSMVISHRLETLEAKIDNLQQCGLMVEEAMELFRVCPFIFCFSQQRVRQNMDFVVNDMELPANSVLKWQYLLKYNLKDVKPRVIILKRIQTLNKPGHLDVRRLASIVAMSEAKFVKKIVKEHPEWRLLNEIYQQALTDASVTTKAGTQSSTTAWCF